MSHIATTAIALLYNEKFRTGVLEAYNLFLYQIFIFLRSSHAKQR